MYMYIKSNCIHGSLIRFKEVVGTKLEGIVDTCQDLVEMWVLWEFEEDEGLKVMNGRATKVSRKGTISRAEVAGGLVGW